jgi:hypothetical protein
LAYGDNSWVNWLRHGITRFDFLDGGDHPIALFPQWGTEVEYGPFWDRDTQSLGSCLPELGSGCDGYTDEETCTGPIITDNLTWDACGRVGRAFVDPEFNTYGFMWCFETLGVKCTPYALRLDVFWTE